ncbi:hypothetical protein D9756_010982 [Leucocoprinus leucothites]|uniref:Uncharacterized protein n=1 Tax=Leucocoprinus leucothites TaxID=201217 RepID=A0A8H5CP43_9AGAR|nr:hypothetical protein D9756_010982 [Leucoagaricus leucothites]
MKRLQAAEKGTKKRGRPARHGDLVLGDISEEDSLPGILDVLDLDTSQQTNQAEIPEIGVEMGQEEVAGQARIIQAFATDDIDRSSLVLVHLLCSTSMSLDPAIPQPSPPMLLNIYQREAIDN